MNGKVDWSESVFLKRKSGLCLPFWCMLTDLPPVRILSSSKRLHPSPKKKEFYRQEEKCVILPPFILLLYTFSASFCFLSATISLPPRAASKQSWPEIFASIVRILLDYFSTLQMQITNLPALSWYWTSYPSISWIVNRCKNVSANESGGLLVIFKLGLQIGKDGGDGSWRTWTDLCIFSHAGHCGL